MPNFNMYSCGMHLQHSLLNQKLISALFSSVAILTCFFRHFSCFVKLLGVLAFSSFLNAFQHISSLKCRGRREKEGKNYGFRIVVTFVFLAVRFLTTTEMIVETERMTERPIKKQKESGGQDPATVNTVMIAVAAIIAVVALTAVILMWVENRRHQNRVCKNEFSITFYNVTKFIMGSFFL